MSDRKHRVAEKKKQWIRRREEIARKARVADWPFWVHLGLLDAHARSRWMAWGMFWGNLILGSACAIAATWEGNFLFGTIPFGLWAVWCYLAIRWVDQYGHWPEGT